MSRDYRAEFMAKSQAYGGGDSARLDAIEGEEVREFQRKLDACDSPREQFILKNEWAASHGGQLPKSMSGQSGSIPASNGGHLDQAGHSDQGKTDARSEYLAKLRAAGLGGGNEGSESYRREAKTDSGVQVRRNVRHEDSACGRLCLDGEEAHFDSVPHVPGSVRVERFDEEGLRW